MFKKLSNLTPQNKQEKFLRSFYSLQKIPKQDEHIHPVSIFFLWQKHTDSYDATLGYGNLKYFLITPFIAKALKKYSIILLVIIGGEGRYSPYVLDEIWVK